MREQDYDAVSNLLKVKNRINKALEQCDSYTFNPDCGCPSQIKDCGYSLYMSDFRDGSGKIADLNGCYVGGDIVDAAQKILMEKLAEVNQALISLGVEPCEL